VFPHHPYVFAPENHPLSGTSRRLRLCHGDFQRPNIFTDGRVHHLIDWELAVWGDPVWDVAAHLHRAGYPPVQQAEAQAVLLGTVPEWTSSAADRQDFAVFLRLERYRSLVLDALRHLRAGAAWEEGRRRAAVQEYGYKLAIAGLDVPAADLMALHVRFWERPAART
jgi:aminoglycoside phosphotransferase (APT) family kinase protein